MILLLGVDEFAHAQERLTEVDQGAARRLGLVVGSVCRALAVEKEGGQARFIVARVAAEGKLIGAADGTVGGGLASDTRGEAQSSVADERAIHEQKRLGGGRGRRPRSDADEVLRPVEE